MLLYIYRLRAHGHRLPARDESFQKPVRGQLYFGPTPLDDFGPRMQARLIGPDGDDVTLPLQYAKIARVEGVMHITGIEYYLRGRKGTPQRWKQSWLCAIHPDDALPILSRIRPAIVTGFEDDLD